MVYPYKSSETGQRAMSDIRGKRKNTEREPSDPMRNASKRSRPYYSGLPTNIRSPAVKHENDEITRLPYVSNNQNLENLEYANGDLSNDQTSPWFPYSADEYSHQYRTVGDSYLNGQHEAIDRNFDQRSMPDAKPDLSGLGESMLTSRPSNQHWYNQPFREESETSEQSGPIVVDSEEDPYLDLKSKQVSVEHASQANGYNNDMDRQVYRDGESSHRYDPQPSTFYSERTNFDPQRGFEQVDQVPTRSQSAKSNIQKMPSIITPSPSNQPSPLSFQPFRPESVDPSRTESSSWVRRALDPRLAARKSRQNTQDLQMISAQDQKHQSGIATERKSQIRPKAPQPNLAYTNQNNTPYTAQLNLSSPVKFPISARMVQQAPIPAVPTWTETKKVHTTTKKSPPRQQYRSIPAWTPSQRMHIPTNQPLPEQQHDAYPAWTPSQRMQMPTQQRLPEQQYDQPSAWTPSHRSYLPTHQPPPEQQKISAPGLTPSHRVRLPTNRPLPGQQQNLPPALTPSHRKDTTKNQSILKQQYHATPTPVSNSYNVIRKTPDIQAQDHVPKLFQKASSAVHNVEDADSDDDEMDENFDFTEEEILNFQPTAQDRQVHDWRLKKMSWSDISFMLATINAEEHLIEAVKLRDRMLRAKLALRSENTHTDKTESIRPTIEKIDRPIKQETPPIKRQSEAPSAMSLVTLREKDKLAWQGERDRLERNARDFEQQLLAERQKTESIQAELNKAQEQLKLKAEVEQKLAKLKEQEQNVRELLKEEQMLRTKAERDLKNSKTAKHRQDLAQAAATRAPAKAQNGGFTFPKVEEEEPLAMKPTPKKKAQQKAGQRDDEHSSYGGKTISQELLQKHMKHLESSQPEDDEDAEPPETIEEEDLSYFVYTVRRKQWLRNDAEPDIEGIVCGQYTYLNKANEAVQREVLRPLGNDGIIIEHDKDFVLHGGKAEHDMAWSQIEVPMGFVKVWVEREIHSAYEGELPKFEPHGIFSKTVYAVKQEVCQAGEIVTTTEEQDEIYTTFDLANTKASEKIFNMEWSETPSRIDDITRKSEADRERKQKLEELEDQKELFSELLQGEDGSWVKVWVVQKTVVGPRN